MLAAPVRMAIGLALLLATVSPSTATAAAKKPDLVAKVVSAPAAVDAPGPAAIVVEASNRGTRRAAASSAAVFLARGTKRAAGDVRLAAASFGALAPGRKRRRTVAPLVGAAVAAGKYRVIVCADAAKRVRERNERNNCRVAANAVGGAPPRAVHATAREAADTDTVVVTVPHRVRHVPAERARARRLGPERGRAGRRHRDPGGRPGRRVHRARRVRGPGVGRRARHVPRARRGLDGRRRRRGAALRDDLPPRSRGGVPATLSVTAVNGAGASSAATALPLAADGAGPALAATCAGTPCQLPETELYEVGDPIALQATDAGAGVQEVRYTVDGSEPTAGHGSVYSAPLAVAAGTTLVKARGFDRVGNAGDPLILLVRSADPLSVTPVLDTARKVTKTIPTAGGSLEATAADGTSYELRIPADALAGEAEISLTPVTGVDGLPFAGGPAGAVQLEPDGLELREPAVLRIQPPAGTMPSPAALALFAYHGDGESFHLYPPSKGQFGAWEAQAVSMRIGHFSGYGAAPSTEAERATVNARAPQTDRDELEQAAAEPMTDARSCALAGGGDCGLDEELEAAALAKFPLVMAQIAAAPPTRDGYDKAYGAGMGWVHWVKVMLGEDALPAESAAVLGALTGLVKRSFDASVRRCRSGGLAAIEDIFFFARQGQLLGLGEEELDPVEAQKCVVFKVEVDSAFRMDHTSRNASDQVIGVEKQDLHAKLTATLRPLEGQEKAVAVPELSGRRTPHPGGHQLHLQPRPRGRQPGRRTVADGSQRRDARLARHVADARRRQRDDRRSRRDRPLAGRDLGRGLLLRGRIVERARESPRGPLGRVVEPAAHQREGLGRLPDLRAAGASRAARRRSRRPTSASATISATTRSARRPPSRSPTRPSRAGLRTSACRRLWRRPSPAPSPCRS